MSKKNDEHHDIPPHLIPSEETVLAADDEEKELNKQLDTEKWVYTEEPDDGLCPYCGCEYERASWASRVKDGTKGICPYDTSISDFIIKFVHKTNVDRVTGTRSVGCFCSPEHEDTLVTYPCSSDYDIRRV